MSKTNMDYTRAAKYFLLQDFWVGFKLESDREEGRTTSGESSKSRNSIIIDRVDAL